MTSAMTILSEQQLSRLEGPEQGIEQVIAACNVTRLRGLSTLRQSVELSTGIRRLRELLSDDVMRAFFMGLQGSRLGFLTDKDRDGGYPLEVVREVLIEGMLRGLRPIGNEINIIANQCYAAVNGVERLVAEFPGLTDLWLTPGVPQMAGDKGAFVPYRAVWILNKQPMEMVRDLEKRADGTASDTRICVKVNSGMGPDAIIGKARRKMLHSIYQRISNSSFALPEGDALDTVGVTQGVCQSIPLASQSPDGVRVKLTGREKIVFSPAIDEGSGRVGRMIIAASDASCPNPEDDGR